MAGLIPQSFIDDVLDRADIVDIIDSRVTLKKSGKNYSACCPFHDEKTPSFSVNPDKQFYYCFGCGAGGNSIGFLMDYDSLDFPAAVETLASQLGLEVPREQSDSKGSQQRRSESQNLYDTLQWACRYYQKQLRQHAHKKVAIDYLKQRGLSGEVARDFALGLAPPGWQNLIDTSDKESSAEQKETARKNLEKSGLLVKKDNGEYYDFFRDRIIFPIRDNRGRVIAFGGRVLDDSKPKYLNSPESPVFSKQRELYGLYEARQANRQLDYLLLVEGYMDVVALVQHGITNAIATLGTSSGLMHLEKIFRHTSKLVVCFDGDAAGTKAAERLLETALPVMEDGREIAFLFLPDGEDPDTFVRSKGKDALLQNISDAMPLEQLLFATAEKNIDTRSDAGKARLSQTAIPLIRKLPNGVFRQLMLVQLAEKTGASLDLLQNQLAVDKNPTSPPQPASTAPSQRQELESLDDDDVRAIGMQKTPVIWAIAILLHHPELALELKTMPNVDAERDGPEAALLLSLIEYIRAQQGAVTTYTLLGHWHGTREADALHNCASRHSPPEALEVARQEFADTLSRLDKELDDAQWDVFVAQLAGKPLDKLTAEEKAKLASIGVERRQKPPQ